MHRNIGGQLNHLVEQLGCPLELDQRQGATQLLQALYRLLQQAAILSVFQKLLQEILYFTHAGEEFIPDKI